MTVGFDSFVPLLTPSLHLIDSCPVPLSFQLSAGSPDCTYPDLKKKEYQNGQQMQSGTYNLSYQDFGKNAMHQSRR